MRSSVTSLRPSCDSLSLAVSLLRNALVEQGKIKYQETRVQGLENAANALLAMFKGENIGKTTVVVSEE